VFSLFRCEAVEHALGYIPSAPRSGAGGGPSYDRPLRSISEETGPHQKTLSWPGRRILGSAARSTWNGQRSSLCLVAGEVRPHQITIDAPKRHGQRGEGSGSIPSAVRGATRLVEVSGGVGLDQQFGYRLPGRLSGGAAYDEIYLVALAG
jgi:hypothetical protein